MNAKKGVPKCNTTTVIINNHNTINWQTYQQQMPTLKLFSVT